MAAPNEKERYRKRRNSFFKSRRRAGRIVRSIFKIDDNNKDYKKVKYKFAIDRKPCSCSMCGNRRDWDGPPIQERKLIEKDNEDDFEDIDSLLESE